MASVSRTLPCCRGFGPRLWMRLKFSQIIIAIHRVCRKKHWKIRLWIVHKWLAWRSSMHAIAHLCGIYRSTRRKICSKLKYVPALFPRFLTAMPMSRYGVEREVLLHLGWLLARYSARKLSFPLHRKSLSATTHPRLVLALLKRRTAIQRASCHCHHHIAGLEEKKRGIQLVLNAT